MNRNPEVSAALKDAAEALLRASKAFVSVPGPEVREKKAVALVAITLKGGYTVADQ